MSKRSKRYHLLEKRIRKDRDYDPLEAIRLIKENTNCNFEESVETAISLNIRPKERGERVRGTVVLPQGSGRKVRVVVFAEGERAEKSKERGADYTGGEELVRKIEKGWLDFDAVVSTPQMMRMVARLGRILGPRGLMPSPKVGTVSEDPAGVVEELKRGRIEFRNDATGVIHTLIGKVSFKEEDLLKNLKALLASVIKEKPATVRGGYIRGIFLCSTMGPSVKVNLQKTLGML